MMIRCSVWLVALAMLVLTAGGCERPETPQVVPQPLPVAEEQKETAAEEEPSPVLAEGKIEEEGAVPVSPVAAKAKQAAPAETATLTPVKAAKPAPTRIENPAPVESAALPPTEVVTSAPAEEKPAKAEVHEATPPQELVLYHVSYGRVSFDHQSHAAIACGSCHTTNPAGKIPLGKDQAHQLCRGCHQQSGAGPTQCNACHQKG
jgi:hypothetical protein